MNRRSHRSSSTRRLPGEEPGLPSARSFATEAAQPYTPPATPGTHDFGRLSPLPGEPIERAAPEPATAEPEAAVIGHPTALQRQDDERLATARAYIVIVGPEIESHGPTVLLDGAASLATKFDESVTVTYEEARSGSFPAARPTDIIYLVAHGDDPNVDISRGSTPGFGEQDAAKLAATLKKILGPLRKKEKFRGTIVLEGCHSAVPEYKGSKVEGPSMLAKLQEVLRDQSRTFTRLMAPEAELAGYLGPSYSSDDRGSIYGNADVESPKLRRELGVEPNELIRGEESVDVRRWRTHGR